MFKELAKKDYGSIALAIVLAHILEDLLLVESWQSSVDLTGVWLHVSYKKGK